MDEYTYVYILTCLPSEQVELSPHVLPRLPQLFFKLSRELTVQYVFAMFAFPRRLGHDLALAVDCRNCARR